jgi:hypothetical protein
MGMGHHRAIQFIEAGPPERTVCDSVSDAHPFPPASFSCGLRRMYKARENWQPIIRKKD